jgi:hypothetical protein
MSATPSVEREFDIAAIFLQLGTSAINGVHPPDNLLVRAPNLATSKAHRYCRRRLGNSAGGDHACGIVRGGRWAASEWLRDQWTDGPGASGRQSGAEKVADRYLQDVGTRLSGAAVLFHRRQRCRIEHAERFRAR